MVALGTLGVLLLWAGPGVDWTAVWQDLRALRSEDPASPDPARVRRELVSRAEEAGDDPRAHLLRAQLDWLDNPSHAVTLGQLGVGEDWVFATEESWLAAEILRADGGRLRALQEALAGTETLDSAQVNLVWATALGELEGLRFDGAIDLLEDLHSRYLAEWSAINLSLAYAAVGRAEEADRVVAEQIQRQGPQGSMALWSRRGNAAWGNGDDRRARDYFGKALALGSSDAAIVLARLDFFDDRILRARSGFRALLYDPEPSAWALRGWGLSLLAEPSEDGGSRPQEPTNGRPTP